MNPMKCMKTFRKSTTYGEKTVASSVITYVTPLISIFNYTENILT